MRGWLVLALVPAVVACGSKEAQHDANAAAANYVPPTVTSRSDFGGLIERRFHRLDHDGDDKLTEDEMPDRMKRLFRRADKDGDGKLSSGEWGDYMLDLFDQQDLNKDGIVTTDEREAFREKIRAAREARPSPVADELINAAAN